ncbi:MAG: MMPL family transporter, partial [Nitrospiraceae bacterium]
LATGLLVLVCVMAIKVPSLETDPSLLEYFDSEGDIYQALDFVDETGGTNPLDIVFYERDGLALNNQDAYQKLWKLQKALEDHPNVGISVSLPVLLAEGKRHPLSFLVSYEKMLKIMSGQKLGNVALGFVTEDRKHTKFLIRMNEKERYKPRTKVISEIEKIANRFGFEVKVAGGLYYLMGRLSEMIRSSMVSGIGMMLFCFLIIAILISRSIRITLAMVACMALVPVFVLGTFSFHNIPMDVISSASLNVCLGMAGDSMIHFVMALRRRVKKGFIQYAEWGPVIKEQGMPILISAVIVSIGFSVFSFSTFPPNQRFGIAVVLGTLFAMGGTLVLFVFAGGYPFKSVKDLTATLRTRH